MVSNHSQVIVTSRLKLYIDGELEVQHLKHPSKFVRYDHSTNTSSISEPKRSPLFLKDPLFRNWNIQSTEARLKSYINGEKTIDDLVHRTKSVRSSPEALKDQQQKKTSEDISTLYDYRSTIESKSATIAERQLKGIESRVYDDSGAIADNMAQRRPSRDNRIPLPATARSTFLAIPERNMFSDEQALTRESESCAFVRTSTNMWGISASQPQRNHIKPKSVVDTLDTRRYESQRNANKIADGCRALPKYTPLNKTIIDHFNAEVPKYNPQRKQNISSETTSSELKSKNEKSTREFPAPMNYLHRAKCSTHHPGRVNKKHSKSSEKVETAEKLRALQTEVNTLTEGNRSLDALLQREQAQNDILQLSLQCLKERAESKIDEITKNFNQISEKLKEAQNDLQVVKADFHPDPVEKPRLEEENNRLTNQAKNYSQKLNQKLSQITESMAILQERRNRLLRAVQSGETSYLMTDELLGF